MNSENKIAVVGSGISGLSAAWHISQKNDVHIFEKNDYFGGHSNTQTVFDENFSQQFIDTGFIVYNELNYPNLSNFFKCLNVQTYASDMSFSVSKDNGKFEYSGSSLSTIFAQTKNIFNLKFLKMIYEIVLFYNNVQRDVDEYSDLTLSEYLIKKKYSDYFKFNHIYPMAASIWSSPLNEVSQYPLKQFVDFFSNHGLFKLINRPKWRTVLGGSRSYVKRVLNSKRIHSFLNSEVFVIDRNYNNKIVIEVNGEKKIFDNIIISSHADEVKKILKDITSEEERIFNKIKFKKNIVYLHQDESLMPKIKKIWSSWNFNGWTESKDNISVTYWMNKLQTLSTKENFFVSLNPIIKPKKDLIKKVIYYSHPLFDKETFIAQDQIKKLQGEKKTWFCGAYLGYGFHEDGIKSGLNVAERISGNKRQWLK